MNPGLRILLICFNVVQFTLADHTYQSGCYSNAVRTAQTGTITPVRSNYYNRYYANSLDCWWRIEAPRNWKIKIAFSESINIESCSSCSCDYLEIYDGYDSQARQIGRWCGSIRVGNFRSSANNLYLKFRTDNTDSRSNRYRGFKLNYEMMAPEKLKIAQDSLVMTATSPNCVSLTWQPAPDVNSYKVNCTRYHLITTNRTSMLHICGYDPYIRVTCSVTCVKTQRHEDDGYVTVPVNVTSYTGCAEPTAPEFNVQDIVQSFHYLRTQPDSRMLTVHITSASQPNCARIKRYTISLYRTRETAHIATRTIASHGEDVAFKNVKPVTNYTVTIVAVNNNDTQSPVINKTIMTQELAPEVVTGMMLNPVSPHCVNMTWSPPSNINGILVGYKYKCTGQNTLSTNSGNITEEIICGFTPYQNVTCNLTAVNSYSDGIMMKKSAITPCTNPTKVSEIDIVQGSHDVNGHPRRDASIAWLVSKANCKSITHYNVTFIHISDAGETAIKENLIIPDTQQLLKYRSTFSDLIGGEIYKIKFVSTNNLDMISETSERQFQAEDLLPYDSVSDFQLRSNSSCVNMSWVPPREPNGLITYYKYKCVSSTGLNANGTIQDDSFNYIENTDKMQYLVCKLPSESKFSCSIQAGNEAGLSPIARNSVYTKFDFDEISLPVITVNDHESISILLKPVVLHHSSLQAQDYLIIVEELSYPDQISQVDDAYLYNSHFSKTKNLTYYVTAKLSFDKSEPDIYFMCGDERLYGGYYNAPLSTTKLYKIHYAFIVQLNGDMITHVVRTRGLAISLTGILPTISPTTVKPTTQLLTAQPTNEPTATKPTVVSPLPSAVNGEPNTLPDASTTATVSPLPKITVKHSTNIATTTATVDVPNKSTIINHVSTKRLTVKVATKPTATARNLQESTPKAQESTVKQAETTSEDHWKSVDERIILRELRCPDPPVVKHADLHDIGQRRWNSTVSYHCDDEYAVSPGHKDTVILTCSKSKYLIELDWTGEIIHCLQSRKVQTGALKSNEGEGGYKSSNTLLIVVCLVLILLVISIALGGVFIIRRKRRKYQLANQNAPQLSIVELTERNGHFYSNNHYATPIVNKHPHSSEVRPERIAADSESQKHLLADDETTSHADDDFNQ